MTLAFPDTNEIHEYDIGTRFLVTLEDSGTAVDLTSATTLEFVFRKPDNTSVVKTATVVAPATGGQLEYFSVTNDLTPIGLWRLQVHIVLASGEWRSDVGEFRVFENLPVPAP